MAEGFVDIFGQREGEVYSAASRPSSVIDPLVIEVMKEKGIDLSIKRPKGLNDLPSIEMDYLITMGCEEACPAIPAKRIIEWEIPDAYKNFHPQNAPLGASQRNIPVAWQGCQVKFSVASLGSNWRGRRIGVGCRGGDTDRGGRVQASAGSMAGTWVSAMETRGDGLGRRAETSSDWRIPRGSGRDCCRIGG